MIDRAASQLDGPAIVAQIGELFARWGAQVYLGEPVTVAQHMLQCAALARSQGAEAPLVAAALLHDIGHFDGGFEDRPQETLDRRHEASGAAWLQRMFPPEVTEPIRLHVAAKRYLCAIDGDYYDALTVASQQSLALQGGPMNPAEAADFRASPFHEQAVRLRRWDDGGKAVDLRELSFADFEDLLVSVLR